ncbi:hypothetical protein SODALDRAFT_125198 [Sodiomyces alkalinus F11]|uniref:GAT domain-containing protein n=1 Tax=Sodiomyces alkalinus (strain CBS 110278 / VKM F-3762 / F11) TaxID=1314773 RepID=A0A3N2Q4L6_SODAK|nr:hypothetical protein SODALDRAFT_125198 [Sodiomyces alkalinus F11]ROT41656.1 hypothetical protein SODALDRAFT_125198 [Sodiomyces alkalinus F11]
MKGFGMNRVLGTIKKRTGTGFGQNANDAASSQDETPEATAVRNVKAFCESEATNQQDDEVLFLPLIVDAAESAPAAAAECARYIRKYLSKDYNSKPGYQYNAIMLLRILSDHPGRDFTRNFDKKFVDTVKDLLRLGRNNNVRHMLMETLENFESTKMNHEGMRGLVAMWQKEKARGLTYQGGSPLPQRQAQPLPNHDPAPAQNYFARHHTSRTLPNPVELASRLEEARNSAKLLIQFVNNTPPSDLLQNALVREFADRCQSASRSVEMYMKAENPAPDNDTMESLIDVNEQLQTALNQHQRAVLAARKHLGLHTNSHSNPSSPQLSNQQAPPLAPSSSNSPPQLQTYPSSSSSSRGPPTEPPRSRKPPPKSKGKEVEQSASPTGPPPTGASSSNPNERSSGEGAAADDPFRDPQSQSTTHYPPENTGLPPRATSSSSSEDGSSGPRRLADESFHPRFGDRTASYGARQDSAMNNVVMHGAGVSQGQRGTSRSVRNDDDDLYEADDLPRSNPRR